MKLVGHSLRPSGSRLSPTTNNHQLSTREMCTTMLLNYKNLRIPYGRIDGLADRWVEIQHAVMCTARSLQIKDLPTSDRAFGRSGGQTVSGVNSSRLQDISGFFALLRMTAIEDVTQASRLHLQAFCPPQDGDETSRLETVGYPANRLPTNPTAECTIISFVSKGLPTLHAVALHL